MSNCRVSQSFNSLNLFIFRQTCNTVNGTYDGSLFPKNVTKNEKFKMYRKAFCRLFPIYFSHAGKLHGIDAYWFELSENAFYDQSVDDDTSCFCESENSCLRKGLGNIAPCYFSKQKIQLFKKVENYKNFINFLFLQKIFRWQFRSLITSTATQHCLMKSTACVRMDKSIKLQLLFNRLVCDIFHECK